MGQLRHRRASAIALGGVAACALGAVVSAVWAASRGRGGAGRAGAGRAGGEKTGGKQRTLTVIGHASVSVPPDEALVSLAIHVQAATAREASTQVNDALGRVLAVLNEQGIVERQIHTTRLHIAPEYHHDERGPRPVQYRASTAVHVIVEDLPRLGELLDALTETSEENVVLQSVDMLARDTSDAAARARAAALALAREKAQQIAQDAGVALGELLSITEELGGMALGMRHAAVGVAYFEATAVRTGEVEVNAVLEVVWALI